MESFPFLRHLSLLAVSQIFLIVACMIASATIVRISEGDIVSSWRVSPTVVLAILSSILNIALSVALSIGISITWWLSAKRGATLAQLHYIWDRGASRSLWMTFTAGSTPSKVALIALFVAAVKFANNPLLQEAVMTVSTDWVVDGTIKLDIAERIPDGLVGVVFDASDFNIVGSREELAIARECFWNNTITTSTKPGYSCDGGTCTGRVKGAGISYSCGTITMSLDLSTIGDSGSPVFGVNAGPTGTEGGNRSLSLITLYSSEVNDSCVATITIDTCTIDAAVVEYPIIIENTTLLLDSTKLPDIPVLSTYTTPGDSPTAPEHSGAGPLSGLRNFIDGHYGAKINASIREQAPHAVYLGDSFLMANFFYQAERTSYTNHTFEYCGLKFSSPTNFILNKMHSYMFRCALEAAAMNNSIEPQTIPILRSTPAAVFKVDYPSLGAALAVISLALASLFILFWGWWELDREVTLSPLELAKAFRAPLLAGVARGNADVKEIIRCVGTTRVVYSAEGGMVGDEMEMVGGDQDALGKGGDEGGTVVGMQEGEDTSRESAPGEFPTDRLLQQNRSYTY